jgi:hypothetical protein
MPENPRYGEEIVNPETHHEQSDVNVRALAWFVVIFVVFAVVAHFVLVLMFNTYVKIERKRNTGRMTGIVRTPDMSLPQNQPLLQPFPHKAGTIDVAPYRNTPVTDLADLRANEQRALDSYGWVDKQRGVVRVPIDVAMRLTLQRGLPVEQRPVQIQTPGAHP